MQLCNIFTLLLIFSPAQQAPRFLIACILREWHSNTLPGCVSHLQGLGIKEHMQDIPQNCDPAPIIRIYVDLNLQTLHKAGVISGPQPLPQEAGPEPAPPSSSTTPAYRGNSVPLGSMQLRAAEGSSGQLAQTVPEDTSGRVASSAAETSPLSSASSMASPGSQASSIAHVMLHTKRIKFLNMHFATGCHVLVYMLETGMQHLQ